MTPSIPMRIPQLAAAVPFARRQEPFTRKPANAQDFRRAVFGERDLPKSQVAEGKMLGTNTLGG